MGLLSSPSFVCRCKTWKCSQAVKFVSFVEVGVYTIKLLSVFLLLLTVVVDSFSNRYKWNFVEKMYFTFVWATLDQWSRQRSSNYLLWPSQQEFCRKSRRKTVLPKRTNTSRNEVVKGFGSEALCKASVWRLKEEGVVTIIYYLDQYISILEKKSSFSGKVWSKMDFR